ncbi:hypothetical protein M0802_006248 [Mischocyttarus mexicanus]|nr:hypothetical protein M0802_006248 [Mischocyttarus mexicanus]
MAPLGTANEPRNAAGAEDQPVVGPTRDAVPSVHDTRDQKGRDYGRGVLEQRNGISNLSFRAHMEITDGVGSGGDGGGSGSWIQNEHD